LTAEARQAQWSIDDLAWETQVEPGRLITREALMAFLGDPDLEAKPFASWGNGEWVDFGIQMQSWVLSQTIHCEQGALVCAGKLVKAVPWIDGKYFGVTLAMDEARHAEVFSRYLEACQAGRYAINAHLCQLLDDVIADSRWDVSHLGMQVIIEGANLATIGLLRQVADEPLFAQLFGLVMADEGRHLDFAAVSLAEVYAGLSAPEIRERQAFALEALMTLRDRVLGQEVWERIGVSPASAAQLTMRSAGLTLLRQQVLSAVAARLSILGLLDAGDGWLRDHLDERGVQCAVRR